MCAYVEPDLMPAAVDILPEDFAPYALHALVDHRPAVRYPSGAGL